MSYIKHIRHTREDLKTTSWCGRDLTRFDWTFLDLDHAAYAKQQESLQVPCKQCVKAAVKVLTDPDTQK